jgi:hypothetical protein
MSANRGDKQNRTVTVEFNGAKPIVMVGVWPHDVKMLTSEEDLKEWERRMEAFTGVKYDAKAFIQGGGGCCGGDGDGMCDMVQ